MDEYVFSELRTIRKQINRQRSIIFIIGVGLASAIYAINKCNERIDKLETRGGAVM